VCDVIFKFLFFQFSLACRGGVDKRTTFSRNEWRSLLLPANQRTQDLLNCVSTDIARREMADWFSSVSSMTDGLLDSVMGVQVAAEEEKPNGAFTTLICFLFFRLVFSTRS
jgi:hypothetical protein